MQTLLESSTHRLIEHRKEHQYEGATGDDLRVLLAPMSNEPVKRLNSKKSMLILSEVQYQCHNLREIWLFTKPLSRSFVLDEDEAHKQLQLVDPWT